MTDKSIIKIIVSCSPTSIPSRQHWLTEWMNHPLVIHCLDTKASPSSSKKQHRSLIKYHKSGQTFEGNIITDLKAKNHHSVIIYPATGIQCTRHMDDFNYVYVMLFFYCCVFVNFTWSYRKRLFHGQITAHVFGRRGWVNDDRIFTF